MNEELEFEKEVDNAINQAIANLALEGMIVTDEEKENLRKQFSDSINLKLLVKKKTTRKLEDNDD